MGQRLTFEIPPRWEEIAGVRSRTSEFFAQHGLPPDVTHAVAMVVCELTENAVKYGTYSSAEDHIAVTITMTSSEIAVELKNPIGKADDGNLSRLDRMIQWIRGYQEPFEAYLQRLNDLSLEALESPDSRLGLVRIAYEGQSILDFHVNENNVLTVSAIRRL